MSAKIPTPVCRIPYSEFMKIKTDEELFELIGQLIIESGLTVGETLEVIVSDEEVQS